MGRYLVAATPGVIAQPLHGVAVVGGPQAALVVFQGVVHRALFCESPAHHINLQTGYGARVE